MFQYPPRLPLAHLPTPLEELAALSRHINGPRLFVKRDDQTGLATGGNKTRKLEFLAAAALAEGADLLLTAGAAQSNNCRQTAAAAAKFGLGCALVLGGEPPLEYTSNLLLDKLFGARLFWAGDKRRGELLQEAAAILRAEGRSPYVIPYGSSNPLGACAFALAMDELLKQADSASVKFQRIFFASSSGGTHAGLVLGARLYGCGGRVEGIAIDKGEAGDQPFDQHIASLATQTAALLGVETTFTPDQIILHNDFTGAGYGVVDELEREAILLAARLEGLLLDPVYTARAFGGMLDLVQRGEIGRDETVLFWHTGGIPALFAYSDDLIDHSDTARIL